ncbi:hypothetical protein [Nannocystis sp. SCPEA4]|uniref:hypothetical protein n=1 Tax=Nannocystis sp. SCPEA4 TaxID=2996787 RepID=UPI00226E0385|nr:hypothetical protein [Nannocystis sp. SCPEA4]MCY1053980.1 hypothetical protein [Nannocystis sp. SCPEA4]
MLDYRFFFRGTVGNFTNLPEVDVFISAYTRSERVTKAFTSVKAAEKVWAVHPHYGIDSDPERAGVIYRPGDVDEADFALGLADLLQARGVGPDSSLMVDITGMIRPELMTVFHILWSRGVKHLVALYSEPQRYGRKSRTQFSRGDISQVRQVRTFESSHPNLVQPELLVLGTGYDVNPMKAAANHKSRAKKVVLIGLPSLLPDMYQENVLRVEQAAESIGQGFSDAPKEYFAGANDPFGTAMTLRSVVQNESWDEQNVYFCPLGTKPQVLGFTLFFLHERRSRPWSIIYPFSRQYNPETSVGVGRIWMYEINLASMRGDLDSSERLDFPSFWT